MSKRKLSTRREIAEFLTNPQTEEELALAAEIIRAEAEKQKAKHMAQRQSTGGGQPHYSESMLRHYYRINRGFRQV